MINGALMKYDTSSHTVFGNVLLLNVFNCVVMIK